MTLEQQVVSFDLARRLKELGVKQESAFYWIYWLDFSKHVHEWRLMMTKIDPSLEEHEHYFSAFTVAELGEMLPYIGQLCYSSKFGDDKWKCIYATLKREGFLEVAHEEDATTEADARAKMLIHLIEQGVVKP